MKAKLSRDSVLLGWPVAAGILVWLALPWMVVVMDDDFWYLRSAVETIQQRRPWTDPWLTPWAASTSVLVACLNGITGRFSFSVHFSLALAAALAAAGLALHLRSAGFGRARAILVSALLLLSPPVLFMFLMFTSVALYMGCLWMCVFLADRRRWGWFFCFWLAGVAARQSAVTWMGLAAWPVLVWMLRNRRWAPRDRSLRGPLLAIAGGVAAVWVLDHGMNETRGQAAVFGALSREMSIGHLLEPLVMSVLALTAGYGCCRFAADTVLPWRTASRGRWFWIAAPVLVTAGVLAAGWFRLRILSTQSCFQDPWAPAFFAAVGAVAGLGLASRPLKPRWDALLVGVGGTLLLAAYGTEGRLFDYHYNDAIFWGFAAAVPVGGSSVESIASRSAWRWIGILEGTARWVLVGLLVAWTGRCYVRQKLEQDRAAGYCVLYETALRSGRLTARQIGSIPFGYVGWRLNDYFASHGGEIRNIIGGFIDWTDQWDGRRGTGVLTTYDRPLRRFREWLPTHNNASLLRSEGARDVAAVRLPLLWFYKARYVLRNLEGDGPPPERPRVRLGEYVANPFPLNDTEWREFIARSGLP